MYKVFVFIVFISIIGKAYSQNYKPFEVFPLEVATQLLENNYQGKDQSLNKLVFTNRTGKIFPAAGWKIFFNLGRTISESQTTGGVSIRRINGDFFEMIPNENFRAVNPNESFVIQFVCEPWMLNITDAPKGFFIQNTESNKFQNLPEVTVIDPPKSLSLKRSQDDKVPATTPRLIFEQNKKIIPLSADAVPLIMPTPMSVSQIKGKYLTVSRNFSIINQTPWQQEELTLKINLNDLLDKCINNKKSDKNQIPLTLYMVKEQMDHKEAYSLSISERGIILKAGESAGMFYAIQTLLHLVDPSVYGGKADKIVLQFIEVKDKPMFDIRAMHLDIARNFHSKDRIKKLLDIMAFYKLNMLHFHFSDDEGWRVEMPSLPELTQVGSLRGYGDETKMLMPVYGSGADTLNRSGSGHLSRKEFIELLRYANDRHIVVLPEIESPGHGRAAIKSMEARYIKYSASGNITEAEKYRLTHPEDKSVYESAQLYNDNVMDVSLESTYTFLTRVIDDLIGMYKEAGVPLESIHLGGDEVPAGVWEKSPAFLALKGKNPLIKSTADLWDYHIGRINEILNKRGLYLSGWEESAVKFTYKDGERVMIPNPKFCNDNVHVDVWNNVPGWGSEDLAYRLANAGYKVMLSLVSHTYFDLANDKDYDEQGYYWGGFIDLERTFSLIPYNYYKTIRSDIMGNELGEDFYACKEKLTDYGKTNILGIKGLMWSETNITEEKLEYKLYPRFLALAERSWAQTPEWAIEKDTNEMQKKLSSDFSIFVNRLGQRELPRLDYFNGGYKYRIPIPGVSSENGKLIANTQFPGLTIRYTTDNSEPTSNSKIYQNPLTEKGNYNFKAFTPNGRSSRMVSITNE